MATWTTPSTKLATAKGLWEIDRTLFKRAYGDKVYPTLDPDPSCTSWTRATSWDEVADDLNWVEREDPLPDFALASFSAVTKIKVGAEAVFELVKAIKDKKICFKTKLDHTAVNQCVVEVANLIAPSTQITPDLFVKAVCGEGVVMDAVPYLEAADAFKYLASAPNWKDLDEEYHTHRNLTIDRASLYYYRKIDGMHFFIGKGPIAQKALCFSKNTYDFLIGACERLENLIDYGKRSFSSAKYSILLKLLGYQIDSAARLAGVTANKVCKAWNEVKTFVQYTILNSIMKDAIKAVEADFVTDGFAEVIDLYYARDLIMSADEAFALELIHVFKWIPPPEYDMTKSLPDIRKLHLNPRKSGAHTLATEEQKEIYADIQRERKMNLATAYKNYTKNYPQSLVFKGSHPTMDEIDKWDHTGTLSYEHLGTDVSSQIKDKTTVLPKLDDELNGKSDIYNQNFLLWYLCNQEKIDTRELLRNLNAGTLGEDEYSRAAYKAEGPKVDGRPFFMAPPKRRLLLGEFEGNNSKIARNYPGSLIGRDEAIKQRMSENTLDITKMVSNPEEITTTFVVMFDVSKWSPKSCGAQVREYHKFWAEVYDTPELECLHKIGTNDTIISTTDGLKISYKNIGADLEGYRSRTSTMYHADLLATACRRSIKKKYISGRSELVVFVDDGAVRIEALGTKKVAKKNALLFLEEMKKVYNAGGQEIHSRKVVISERGGEILSNFYLDGVKVPQGLKASMKLAPDYSDPVATLPSESDALFAASQGAVKAGANPFTTYFRYVQALVRTIIRYYRGTIPTIGPTGLALTLITPKSFGGVGLQSFQGLVTTAVVNQTAEGVAMLNRVARVFPSLRPAVIRLFSIPVVVREPLDILRDPSRVRLALPTMVESRMIQLVVEEMSVSSPVFRNLVKGDKLVEATKHATELAIRLTTGDVLSAPILDKAWRSTLLHEIESTVAKFEKAQTIIGLLGYKFVGKVRRRNIQDVKKIISSMSTVFMVH